MILTQIYPHIYDSGV